MKVFNAEAASVLMVDHDSKSLRRVGYCDSHGTTPPEEDPNPKPNPNPNPNWRYYST